MNPSQTSQADIRTRKVAGETRAEPVVPSAPAARAARGAARLIGPAQLLLLAALPVAWIAPLFSARVPFLWREDISILSGLEALWRIDLLLFTVVLVFSVVTPLTKLLASAWLWYRVPVARAAGWSVPLTLLGKLAMTEVFLLAVLIVGLKGVGIGRVEIDWGIGWLTATVLATFAVSLAAESSMKTLRAHVV